MDNSDLSIIDPEENPCQVKQFCYTPKILNGGIAGIVGVSCVFPLDLIKTRMQNSKTSTSIVATARQTWRAAAPNPLARAKAFYQGASINVLLITPEKAIKLVANDFFRHKLCKGDGEKLSPLRGMAAGGAAGLFQVIVTTPMELLKIRMQQSATPVSAIQAIRSVISDYGLLGLYRGVLPTMCRDVAFSIIYFPLFAQLDSLGPRKKDGSGDAVFWTSFVSGLTAGALSSLCVTPLDVVKTRIQAGVTNRSVPEALMKITRDEGPSALFKGAACRMMVMAPLFGIAQTVYYIGVAEKIFGWDKCSRV